MEKDRYYTVLLYPRAQKDLDKLQEYLRKKIIKQLRSLQNELRPCGCKKLHRRLRQLGYKGEFKHIKMQSWKNSCSPLVHYALPNKHFKDFELYDLGFVETGITVSLV